MQYNYTNILNPTSTILL